MHFLYRRIVALLLCFVILFLFCFSVSAVESLPYSEAVQYWDWFRGDTAVGFTTFLNAIFSRNDQGCMSSVDGCHLWTCLDTSVGLRTNSFLVECIYCGLNYREFQGFESGELSSDDLSGVYDTFVESLDSTAASSGLIATGFSCSAIKSWYSYEPYYSLGYICRRYPVELKNLLYSLGLMHKVAVFNINYYSPYHLIGIFWGEDGQLMYGYFENPLASKSASLFGVYAIDDLTMISSYSLDFYDSNSKCYGSVYFNKAYAESNSDFLTSNYFAVDWSRDFSVSNGFWNNVSNTFIIYIFKKDASSTTWDSQTKYCGLSTQHCTSYFLNVDNIIWDNTRIIIAPSNTDSSSRISVFSQLLSLWNQNHSDLSSPNYFFGVLDSDGNISGYYNPSVYDEDKLVFTEPVTGGQYQTTGWKYDYTSRSYDIDLDSGTFSIDDTDIVRILCTYGDDSVTINYYDSSGTAVQSDEFAYVVAASSECALNGHSYTVAITKEPSCTAVGERTYTCSVCGDQYVEEISMDAHRYTATITKPPTCTSAGERTYTCAGCGDQYIESIPASEHVYTCTILKEPTCTDFGVYIYTCSTCGSQYTDSVEALGHDWLSTETSETSYSLPDGISCPECDSLDFVCVLDDVACTYSCTCNSCGSTWTVSAVVTYGYTVYTCSRCGETKVVSDSDGNGLFTSIGNFIADGIKWTTDKLSQLVDSLTSILDTFNDYLDVVGQQSSSYPSFLGSIIGILPEDLTAVLWFGLVAFVVVAVIKVWFS